MVVEAGRTLSLRFKEKGQYLRSFVADESLFIDIMMNVGIIFYAAQQTGDANLLRIATQHSLTTRRYLVRGDGSTAHEGIFDLESGEFLRQSTHQGWRDDSSWARGLCLGAVRLRHGLRLHPRSPASCTRRRPAPTSTSSARRRTACRPTTGTSRQPGAALRKLGGGDCCQRPVNLARLTGDTARARLYKDYALRILDTLTTPEFLASETPGWEGILKHGMYHQRRGLGVDESVMWGEYFFVEALCKALGYE